ncbi:MAG: tRNA preQ1(34) S-adenosylmethionine ribosyltransferase-isomerase QueA [Phycisphaeraceae bacterium]|nr:MAG: tRNA preQ1(34) S-adenosylmethionine ribosyltransferase-isomerase QueA [Phycisphaeraceae bacterium]
MRVEDLDYQLPEDRLATHPADPRDSARLMVVDRSGARPPEDRVVRDLPDILRPGDVMVFNATRVIRARLAGVRADTGGAVEGLYLAEEAAAPGGCARWRVMLRGRRMKPGVEVALRGRDGSTCGVSLWLETPIADEPGAWVCAVRGPGGDLPAESLLERFGQTPLPPYIVKARSRRHDAGDDEDDRARYQTTYARPDAPGSVAAPTAGLHFTPELLARLDRRGVERHEVVLHVGTGTFRPVETERVEDHPMHSERCWAPAGVIDAVRRARAEGRRVFAVGTTTARTLESVAGALEDGSAAPGPGGVTLDTRLLITPGYRWRWVDGLLTNFHLPRSTLLAMVGSMAPDGVEGLKSLYARAIAGGYRFYSYGDAMLLEPAG